MPLLNYTTEVEAAKTVGEIQVILAGHGARCIMMDYDGNGNIEALSFTVMVNDQELPIKLPINPDAVLKVMQRQSKVPYRLQNRPQAIRVAWRIVKEWVSAQMAILETNQAKMEQIFLPYVVTQSGKTVFEIYAQSQFQLKVGTPAPAVTTQEDK